MRIVQTNEIFNKYSAEADFLKEDDRYWSKIEKIALDIKNNPIGFFDSGVGGLSVMREAIL